MILLINPNSLPTLFLPSQSMSYFSYSSPRCSASRRPSWPSQARSTVSALISPSTVLPPPHHPSSTLSFHFEEFPSFHSTRHSSLRVASSPRKRSCAESAGELMRPCRLPNERRGSWSSPLTDSRCLVVVVGVVVVPLLRALGCGRRGRR